MVTEDVAEHRTRRGGGGSKKLKRRGRGYITGVINGRAVISI